MVDKTSDASNPAKKAPFEAAALVALVIACPGEPNTKSYAPAIVEDAELMDAWLRKHGFETQKLIHTEATEEAITDWFDEQTMACINLKKSKANPSKKFVLFCFYAGHCDKNGDTIRVHLPDSIFNLKTNCASLARIVKNTHTWFPS